MTAPTDLPDVTDPDVRAMVLRGHEPQEAWSADWTLRSVQCRTCGQRWPCPSIQAVRRHELEAARKPRPNPSRPRGEREPANAERWWKRWWEQARERIRP